MRALVVDDSRAMRSILKQMLAAEGFDVVEAGNGKDALAELAGGGPVDLALLDWNMPEMNGYELLCAMRATRALDATRIMMVTTETEVSQITKALAAGANEYVMKPFDRAVIAEKLGILGLAA